MSEKTGLIYSLIPKIMADIEPIAKDKQGAGYKFRGIDDVYEAVQLVLAKHGVFCVPKVLEERSEERTSKSGGALIYRILKIRYTFFATDGSYVESEVIGEGMDSGDKASNKAMSVAQKYAILQVFCIPTREPKDPEEDSHDVGKKTISVADKEMIDKNEAVTAFINKCKSLAEEGWRKDDFEKKLGSSGSEILKKDSTAIFAALKILNDHGKENQ